MFELIKKEINSDDLTFTYSYIPYVDTLEHQNSPYNELVYKVCGNEEYICKF